MGRVNRVCKNCGCQFTARSADVARGWAVFCSKSCKAQKQARDTGYYGPEYEFDDSHPFSEDAVQGGY